MFVRELKAKEYKPFEDIRRVDENGHEYWSARELADVLEYTEWRNFEKVIDKAMIACQNSGHELLSNFVDVSKTVPTGVSSHTN